MKFETPRLEIAHFYVEDVIAASAPSCNDLMSSGGSHFGPTGSCGKGDGICGIDRLGL